MSSSRVAAAHMREEQQHQKQSSPTSVASGPQNNNEEGAPLQKNEDGAPSTKHNVTPPPKQQQPKRKQIDPLAHRDHPDMEVKDNIIDELYLIGGVIGSTATIEDGTEKFIPNMEALEWLQDLQRVLKRDHEIYRPILLKIGNLRIMAQKLFPLLIACRADRMMVMTICKILVILTKPMNESAKKAGRMSVDVKNKKIDPDIIREQIVLRDNAIEQAELLMEYKRLFVKHATHHYCFQAKKPGAEEKTDNSKKGSGLLSVFASFLDVPLSKTGSERTANDHLIIELVLHLIRNLLSIAPLNTFGSPEKSQYASNLHRELLIVMKEEMVFEVLRVVCQDIERRENQGYNLLVMEIMHHVLRGQDPSDVALSVVESPMSTVSSSTNNKKKSKAVTRVVRTATRAPNKGGADSLKSLLQTDRQKVQLAASSRHSHFGGTLSVSKADGKQSYVSASNYLKKTKASSAKSGAKGNNKVSGGGVGQPVRRKNKKAEVFVGSGKGSTAHSGSSVALTKGGGPNTKRAYLALNSFCIQFMADCYGPVMKSLKNEFRRDSSRLETGDRIMLFRIVWFFTQWWRVAQEQQNKAVLSGKKLLTEEEFPSDGTAANKLVFTMDVYMFNLIFKSTDEFHEHKKPSALTQTVALYTEMIHMLHAMYNSKDKTEHAMSLGLMDRLFYQTEPLDRLPKLLARWTPGLYSREHLCDLVECSHVTWRLLDANAQRVLKAVQADEKKQRPKDATDRFNLAASEFDTNHYFERKFVSNQIVFMYTQLLSQYGINAAHVNRHIAAYFIRLCKHTLNINGDDDLGGGEFDDALGKNELATKQTTFEPMLYNIGMFTVLDKILNDPAIRDREDYASLLTFASSLMKRFAQAAETNPMLYVEALFKHPNHRSFCEAATNLYVNEEVRMIAVRDLLLEDQRRYEQAEDNDDEDEVVNKDDNQEVATSAAAKQNTDKPGDEESEEEVEFNEDDMDEDIVVRATKKRRSKPRKSRKSKFQWEKADDDDEENNEKDGAKDDDDIGDKNNGDDSSGNVAEGASANNDEEEKNETSPSAKESESPNNLSGKKRIRKSLGKQSEDSDDDDEFLGSSAPASKVSKRVIFDDDDDDE